MNIRVNLQMIPVGKIKPNPWNPNKQSDFIFEKERQSIRDHGFLDPVLVREKGSDFEIIDGEHRFRAGLAESFSEIPCNNLGQVTDAVAKQLTVIMNETRGRADQTLLQTLMREIAGEIGAEALIQAMPMQRVDVEAMLANAAVDWEQISPTLTPAAPAVVIGEDAPPPAPSPTPLSPKNEQNPPPARDVKLLAIELPSELFRSFYEQMDIIREALPPSDRSDVAAIQAMVELLRHNDLKSAIQGPEKVVLKKAKSASKK